MSSRLTLVLAIVLVVVVTNAPGYPRKLQKTNQPQREEVLWKDPGAIASLDFRYGIGGPENQPQPPFSFDNEDLSGTNPKVNVIDARGAKWNIKWGDEVRPSIFCTRLAWATGYVVDAEYFVAQGYIEGAHGLTRTRGRISKDGSFSDARFQLRPDSPQFLKDDRWTWTDNPFLGTNELQGLKILTLLVSNMDAKNVNLGIFIDNGETGPRYLYGVIDWGSSLGRWGNIIRRSAGKCGGFADQTPEFVKAENGKLRWGFSGKHRGTLAEDITITDVQWLLRYLGKITDEQLRTALEASGIQPPATDCYMQALRERIAQLLNVVAD